MKRFFSEFGFIMRNRKHFFFLVLVWTTLSIATFAYGIGLKNTVAVAFEDKDGKSNTYTYEIEGTEDMIISAAVLQQEITLNELLISDDKFSYYTWLDTTSSVEDISNMDLVIDSDAGLTEEDQSDGQKLYKVRTLFVDASTAKAAGLGEYLNLFDEANDYSENVPMLFGYDWFGPDINPGTNGKEIITEIDNYKLVFTNYMLRGTEFSLDGTKYDLDKYIVIPLGTLTENNIPGTQEGRKRWYNIYRIKNQGKIVSDMSANSLQKYLDDLLAENGVEYRLLVEGAEHSNRILFRDDVDEIVSIVINIGYGALALSLLLLLVYLITNYSISSRYLFLAHITGTGKIEFMLIGLLQLLIYFALSAGPAFVIIYGLSKVTSVSLPAYKFILLPAVILVAIGMMVNIIRILLWDAGKKLRNV